MKSLLKGMVWESLFISQNYSFPIVLKAAGCTRQACGASGLALPRVRCCSPCVSRPAPAGAATAVPGAVSLRVGAEPTAAGPGARGRRGTASGSGAGTAVNSHILPLPSRAPGSTAQARRPGEAGDKRVGMGCRPSGQSDPSAVSAVVVWGGEAGQNQRERDGEEETSEGCAEGR